MNATRIQAAIAIVARDIMRADSREAVATLTHGVVDTLAPWLDDAERLDALRMLRHVRHVAFDRIASR